MLLRVSLEYTKLRAFLLENREQQGENRDGLIRRRGGSTVPPQPTDAPKASRASVPTNQQDRTLGARRRAMPRSVKLERYERRAAGRRDRAVRHPLSIVAVARFLNGQLASFG